MTAEHHDRREFLKRGGAALAGSALARGRVEASPAFDLLLRGATVLDGTGAPAFPADVAVAGDVIAALGKIAPEQAKRVLDAAGLHLAPGFVDIHSHSDGDVLLYPGGESRILQGVTSEVTGNCGYSAAPLFGEDLDERKASLREQGIEPAWTSVASYLDRLDATGIALNQLLLLGQGTLRRSVVGLVDRGLTEAEHAAVLRAVEEGLDQGAFGLSSGLEYVPGRYTPTEEIVAMARVVARRGGLYASHVRNEEAALLEAVDEAIAIGRRAGVRVQVSHLKASGRPNWSRQQGALDLIESARGDGVMVLADAYPYTAYSTGLTILLPDWALEGGGAAMLARIADPAERAKLRAAVDAYMARELGDYALIVISDVKASADRALVGRTMASIAESWQLEPAEAVLTLLEQSEGEVSYVGHGMSPENVERVLAHPLVMASSDGAVMAPVGRAAEARPHPRSYGAFARVLAHYVRERKLFDLETAVRKMTSLPADQVGLRDRGRVARGQKADLVVFDAARVEDAATFEDPHRFATGFRHVLVNGVLVVEDGQVTGARPGRALRKT